MALPHRLTAAGAEGQPQKTARRGHGWPDGREMAGTGTAHILLSAGEPGMTADGDVKCDARPENVLDLLARAVLLVAGLPIPEHDRAAILTRVVAAMSPPRRDS